MTLKVALTILLIAILLTGCASQRQRIEYVYPPETLIQDCAQPEINPQKWGDLPPLVIEFKAAIDLCNADKKALREWNHGK